MKRCIARICVGLIFLSCALPTIAQQAATPANGVVPALVNFSGVLTDVNGKLVTGTVGVTFSLYSQAQGGSPLWLETQNVQVDSTGHYKVALGSASSHGLPAELFVSAEARWLDVRVQGQTEQPRVLLLSVPYALKAGDAQTVGGLPPSAFVLAAPIAGNSGAITEGSNSGEAANPALGGSGTVNFIPLWTPNGTTLGNSVFFQSGTGSSAKVGLGLTSPLATLDINGTTLVRGVLETITEGVATPTKAFNSHPLDQEASAYSSSTHKAVMQHFEWQAEPTGNNTSSPGATLNLLFGTDNNTPAETGLKLSKAGVFTFAAGQTFPGTGDITAVNAGTDLTGGGSSGSVTLNLDTTKVPQLATSNTFAATQQIDGDLDATGNVNANGSVNGGAGVFIGSANEGVFGETSGEVGVLGSSTVARAVEGDDSAVGGLAVFGDAEASTGNNIGVLGQSFSPSAVAVQGASFASAGGFGVFGFEERSDSAGVIASGVRGEHQFGSSLGPSIPYGSGVWGDTGDDNGLGMMATADGGNAMAVFNNSTSSSTMFISNFQSSNPNAFILDLSSNFGGFCNFLANGTLSCSGALSTAVPAEGDKKVSVYSVQSPENWFEDFGSGQLTGGIGRVQLESTFAETVNMGADYHVFVTPKGDCKGLYVTGEGAGGFEVRELGGGRSNVGFDYRIVAHRKGYENLRLADATEISKVPVVKRRTVQMPAPSRPVPQAPARGMAKMTNPLAKTK
jgi:hypothetical protein